MDLEGVEGNQGDSAAGYRSYLTGRHLALPLDLEELLQDYDGAIIRRPGLYVHIWSADELASLNAAYAVDEFAPGLVLFGSDGGNVAFALCHGDSEDTAVATVPLVGISRDETLVVGSSLGDLLQHLAAQAH